MRVNGRIVGSVAVLIAFSVAHAQELPVASSSVDTAPLYAYDGAPATPDADDPAIWRNSDDPAHSLLIGTLKDAGLAVFDLRGKVLQIVAPANLPAITPADPPTPAGRTRQATEACTESDSGKVFGRFNAVDIAYGVVLTNRGSGTRRADIAVVTDRGCDRLRFYEIAPNDKRGPLIDMTSAYARRVYPWRIVQPSPLQPSKLKAGLRKNPLDEQNSVYGLGLWQQDGQWFAFVSQRSRAAVSQVLIYQAGDGGLSYHTVRVFQFDPVFSLQNAGKPLQWTPCRENAADEPQSEGIVVDRERDELYVAFETIGVYKLPLRRSMPFMVKVNRTNLFEPAKNFGLPYWAIPTKDEFDCKYEPAGVPSAQALVAAGTRQFSGKYLAPDVEGLAITYGKEGAGYVLASSQGDDTFHVFERGSSNRHIATFAVQDTADTDGLDVIASGAGGAFPSGLLVVQNGQARQPSDTSDINGYQFDGATQFKLVSWAAVLELLGLAK